MYIIIDYNLINPVFQARRKTHHTSWDYNNYSGLVFI